MPTLIVQQRGRTEAGVLAGPVLIGRVRACGVVVDSNDVSRVHAWVGLDADGAYFVADTFSREGTRVNGTLIDTRRKLVDGDEIFVGEARIVYQSRDVAPADALPLDFVAKRWAGDAPDVPIRFLCTCGQTIAVSTFFAGKTASCAYCNTKLVIPRSSGLVVGASVEHGAAQTDCSICQCAISQTDAQTACPGCGLSFHTDCWHENKGCSAYGCPQVNALVPKEVATEEPTQLTDDDAAEPTPAARRPVGPIVLGLCVFIAIALATVGYLMFMR